MTAEDAGTTRSASRRLLLQSAAGGAALLAIGGAARLTQRRDGQVGDDAAGAPPREGLTLATEAGSDVETLTFALDRQEMQRISGGRWETRQLPTSTHSMVGFTWGLEHEAPRLLVRSRRSGTWGEWQRVTLMDDLAEETDRSQVAGADLTWVGDADGVQVRVEGPRPPDLRLVLLHPRARAADTADALDPETATAPTTETASWVPFNRVANRLRPELVSRKAWGAQKSLRTGRPTIDSTLYQVHIHHTVNSNSYRRADVPALVRGMYAYHTQSLGWSDIGYNFLVDRFGRVFVGRAGGVRRSVRGAHTRGFNTDSTGIAAIGNYDVARPSPAMVTAIAQLAAWKLAPTGRRPRGRRRITSQGSSRYSRGTVVRLPVIDGHRDTNQTACPGQYLYARLPRIRRRAARMLAAATAA